MISQAGGRIRLIGLDARSDEGHLYRTGGEHFDACGGTEVSHARLTERAQGLISLMRSEGYDPASLTHRQYREIVAHLPRWQAHLEAQGGGV